MNKLVVGAVLIGFLLLGGLLLYLFRYEYIFPNDYPGSSLRGSYLIRIDRLTNDRCYIPLAIAPVLAQLLEIDKCRFHDARTDASTGHFEPAK